MKLSKDFFKGPNEVFEIGLNPYQISVYLYLCRCGNDGKIPFPGLRTIEAKCGMSRPKVIKTLEELEALGLINKEKRVSGSGNKSNVYTLHAPTKLENDV
jgi:DNA-binding MarR family transcriptional regulator